MPLKTSRARSGHVLTNKGVCAKWAVKIQLLSGLRLRVGDPRESCPGAVAQPTCQHDLLGEFRREELCMYSGVELCLGVVLLRHPHVDDKNLLLLEFLLFLLFFLFV
jgi:hypothetical protein